MERELFSRRSVIEAQEPAVLLALKEKKLAQLSDLEADIHLINDVLDAYGATRVATEEEYIEAGMEVSHSLAERIMGGRALEMTMLPRPYTETA